MPPSYAADIYALHSSWPRVATNQK